MRGAGSSGNAQGAAIGAANIRVTASDKNTPYTSSSAVQLDGVHVLRQSDIVEGQGITTASLASGRSVRVSVDPSGLNALGYLTTSTVRTVAGHPLYVTSNTLNYVDIGTTGGRHSTWEGLTFAGQNDGANIHASVSAVPNRSTVKVVAPKAFALPGTTPVWGNYIEGYPVNGLTTEDKRVILGHRYASGAQVSTNTAALLFYATITGGLEAAYSQDIWLSSGSEGINMEGGSINMSALAGTITASGALSALYIGGTSADWPSPQAKSIHASESVLAKNDLHAGDGIYAGDPLGNITGTINTNGHLRTYGNMLADPNTSDRYGTIGTINVRTGGTLGEGVLRLRTDTTNGGGIIDLVRTGATATGYPSGNPAVPQLAIQIPTYITGQLGASGDIYTSNSVFATNDVQATDDLIALDDLSVTDDGTITDLATVGRLTNVSGAFAISSVGQMNLTSGNSVFGWLGSSFVQNITQPSGTNLGSRFEVRSTGNASGEFRIPEPGASGTGLNSTNYYTIIRNTTDDINHNVSDSAAAVDFIFQNTDATQVAHMGIEGGLSVGSTTPPTTAGRLTCTSFQINSRAAIDDAPSGSATIDFASIAAGAIGTGTITVTGAATGDKVDLGPPSTIEAGLMWCGFVSASNTVTVRVHNTTGGAIDPASASWTALVWSN